MFNLVVRSLPFAVLVLAVAWAGPQQMDAGPATGVVGAIPPPNPVEPCNANAVDSFNCPAKVGTATCAYGAYNGLRVELPGTNITSRFNNDKQVCYHADPACTKYTLKKTNTNCTVQQTP
ncbi:MAG: hypothetical protein K2X82_16935 [Gemmataceae bacterium]|nr:hypothetical protein [Gemmataceae bacterium]